MELIVDIKKKLPGHPAGNGDARNGRPGFTLDIRFEAGVEALGLLGASGAGKSMTLRCIAGLDKPDEGRIVLNGRVLFDSEQRVNIPCRKRRTGFLFQNYALFPNMTVEENIGFALEGLDKKQRGVIVRQKLEMVKLEGLEKRYPFQLSGGQQQRVALARALAIEPEVLLLDEPLSALDGNLRGHMVKQLTEALSCYPGTALFVTHNLEEAYRVCNKLVILSNGRVEAQGDREKLFQKPPTLATARMTGCKNLSAASRLSRYELEAAGWGVKLKTKEPLREELRHVGIRAHYLRAAAEYDRDNVFQCWPGFTSETPFRVTVYLSIGKRSSGPDDCWLEWDISRERWLELQRLPPPWSICLSPERLIPIYS